MNKNRLACDECEKSLILGYQIRDVEYCVGLPVIDISIYYCNVCGKITEMCINNKEPYRQHNISREWELEKEVIDLAAENRQLRRERNPVVRGY